MIICRNCGNEVADNEIFCHCCSHKVEENLENYQRSPINKIQCLSNNKNRFISIVVVSTVIVCFCIPLVRSYKLNHDIYVFEQSFNNKEYNTAKKIYDNDKNNKKFSQQIRNYISGEILRTKNEHTNKKIIASEVNVISKNTTQYEK